MSADIRSISTPVDPKIECHAAWCGPITGLKAEKLLEERLIPHTFLLRKGESQWNYYLTFVQSNLTIKHQPFAIIVEADSWFFEYCGLNGPFTNESIEDVLHLIMLCAKEDCVPFIQKDTQLFFDFTQHS